MADAGYTTYADFTTLGPVGLVESVTVRETTDPKYPCGWDYGLHLGTLAGTDLLRYDNAHERTKGHEMHTPAGSERINFPGMWVLYYRFKTEVGVYRAAARPELEENGDSNR